MEDADYGALLASAKSPEFSLFDCIHDLQYHISNIGVLHFLVQRLYHYSYLDLEFYIPQFIQILVSYETDSMALQEFLLDYSKRYPHFCLVTFWTLQTYIFELKDHRESYSFQIVRSFINELQELMFSNRSIGESLRSGSRSEFRENFQPSLILCGALASLIAMPESKDYIKPIVVSQSKQQKSFLFKLANFHKALTKNLTIKNSRLLAEADADADDDVMNSKPVIGKLNRTSTDKTALQRNLLNERLYRTSDSLEMPRDLTDSEYHSEPPLKINTRIVSKNSRRKVVNTASSDQLTHNSNDDLHLHSHSMPDLRDEEKKPSLDDLAITPVISNSSSISLVSIDQQDVKPKRIKTPTLIPEHQVQYLHSNYFKKETEFMMALQNVSMRLSLVPKEARLTALRAELSIINDKLLPSEIDIPQLLPASSQLNRKFHKILRLSVNETCVLNSAERVPYLLLIEYLSEELDFDPSSNHNKAIISSRAQSDQVSAFRSQSGLDNASKGSSTPTSNVDESLEEADLGDISVVSLSNERSFLANHLTSKQTSNLSKSLRRPVVLDNLDEEHTEGPFAEEVTLVQDPSVTRSLSTQMRVAAVMLQQLEKSGKANSDQSNAIKKRIIDSMKALQDQFDGFDYDQIKELKSINHGHTLGDAGERKLENDFKLGEDWLTKKNRIRQASSYGHLKNWDICSVIVKNGDDLPQEAFACQLISIISNIWRNENIGVWTKNMKILVTSANSGLVETINNSMSIHSIKKSLTEISINNGSNPRGRVASLKDYFLKVYGNEDSQSFKTAQKNFTKSLAAYSIICYVLQIKDRHNGNIMLDNEGHIIHIDFGFLLSNSPGSVGFEAAPFKFTFEYTEVMGGMDSANFELFRQLCKESFKALRKNCNNLINIVTLMQKDSGLPCFRNGAQTSVLLKQRLQLDLTEEECDNYVDTALIAKSIGSIYTRLYDQFQLLTQGIYT